MTEYSKQFEYYIFPGVRHGFDIAGRDYNAQAAADADQNTLAFLKAKLQ